jgi:hypothetical protein
MTVETGDIVHWHWGQGVGSGRVVERHTCRISRRIDGSDIVRNGTADNPALVIAQEDGRHVLKLESELRPG